MQVKDIMTEPVTIDKSERVGHALDIMEKHDLRRLLVTNDGKGLNLASQCAAEGGKILLLAACSPSTPEKSASPRDPSVPVASL